MKRRTVFGIVRTTEEADELVAELLRAGMSAADISLVFPNERAEEVPAALLRLLTGMGAFVAAGLGPIIAGGPVSSAFAAAGSAIGALVRLGMQESDACDYENDLARGYVVIAVDAEQESEHAHARFILVASHAERVVATAEPRTPVVKTASVLPSRAVATRA